MISQLAISFNFAIKLSFKQCYIFDRAPAATPGTACGGTAKRLEGFAGPAPRLLRGVDFRLRGFRKSRIPKPGKRSKTPPKRPER
jgi:hypothetical protein